MKSAALVDAVAAFFGVGRAILGHWPHQRIVQSAVAEIEQAGGVKIGEYGTPAGELECLRFRIGGRRLRLCIYDYGDVTLWGPTQLDADLSKRLSLRLASEAQSTP